MKVIAHLDQPREQWRAGVETRMQVSAGNGASQLCLFEQWVQPGVGTPTHQHPVEEVLTVIAGIAEMWIDEGRLTLIAGQSLSFLPNENMGLETLAPKRFTSRPCWRRRSSRRLSKGPPSR